MDLWPLPTIKGSTGNWGREMTDYLRRGQGWVDVRAFLPYGFVTDGSVDYNTEIQAAIDAAAEVNGILLVPGGIYLFNTGLIIQDESVVFQGAGAVHKWNAGASATTLLYGGSGDAITLNNITGAMGGIVFRDFELRDKTPGTANDGIVFTTAGTSISNVVIDNVQITGFGRHGIYSSGTVFEVTLRRVGTRDCLDDSIKVELGVGKPSQWKFLDCWLTSTAGKWCANIYMSPFYFSEGTIAGRYTGHGLKAGGMCRINNLNIEGRKGANTIGLQYVGGSMCIVEGCTVIYWGTGLKIGEGAAGARGFEFRGHVAGSNDDYDVHLVDGGPRDRTKIIQVGYAAGVIFPVILNERETKDNTYYELQIETMKTGVKRVLANDGTPSVAGGTLFQTGGTTTITDFDDGIAGQEITILCTHSLTFDFTTAQDADHNLDGSSADITADSGDTLKFFCVNSLTWRLEFYLDASVDNN